MQQLTQTEPYFLAMYPPCVAARGPAKQCPDAAFFMGGALLGFAGVILAMAAMLGAI